jgi:hypothetical protein
MLQPMVQAALQAFASNTRRNADQITFYFAEFEGR